MLLNPRIDVVFKMLFTREPVLLRSMLEAVLARRIGSTEVLNPEIPGDLIHEKNITLDVRVLLDDGSHIDVEMQIRVNAELRPRLVFYAARDYSRQLNRGDRYAALAPSIVVVWLVQPMFTATPRFHSIFELRERELGELFSDHLAIHVLQLRDWRFASPKLTSTFEVALQRWARFLAFKSPHDLAQLAQEDPIMTQAADSLERLSNDPRAAELANDREVAMQFYELGLEMSRRAGLEEGLQEGLRRGIRQLCRSVGIELTERDVEVLQHAPTEQLQRLLEHVSAHRTWPET